MRSRYYTLIVIALVIAPSLAFAQTRSMFSNLANPSIGMNAPVFRAGRARSRPALRLQLRRGRDQPDLHRRSLLDLTSNIVFAPDGVDPEEVWARTTSIPGIQLKVGKLRGTFGKHGLLHTHAFPFIQAPVIMANTIGEEGFKDAGMEASWLTPLPWFSELTGGIYQAIDGRRRTPAGLRIDAPRQRPVPGPLQEPVRPERRRRRWNSAPSFLQGRGSDGTALRLRRGPDVPQRSAAQSNQRGWILQGEYIQKGTSAGGAYSKEQNGWYASFQYRLSQTLVDRRSAASRRSDSYTDFLVDDAGDPMPGKVTRGSATSRGRRRSSRSCGSSTATPRPTTATASSRRTTGSCSR